MFVSNFSLSSLSFLVEDDDTTIPDASLEEEKPAKDEPFDYVAALLDFLGRKKVIAAINSPIITSEEFIAAAQNLINYIQLRQDKLQFEDLLDTSMVNAVPSWKHLLEEKQLSTSELW